jgi:hypothetical protein
VINEAQRTGAAPNISDALTINGQPGALFNCSRDGKTHFLIFQFSPVHISTNRLIDYLAPEYSMSKSGTGKSLFFILCDPNSFHQFIIEKSNKRKKNKQTFICYKSGM